MQLLSTRYALLLWVVLSPLLATAQSSYQETMQLADADFLAERYDSAMAHYTQAHILAPAGSEKQAKADLGLARCYLDLWDYPKAIPLLQKVVHHNGILRGDALSDLAYAYGLKGYPDQSLPLLDMAEAAFGKKASNEQKVRLQIYRGLCLNDTGKEKEAITAYQEGEKIIQKQPNAVSEYEKARLYGCLARQYNYFGWVKSERGAVKNLRIAMEKLPNPGYRWGNVFVETYFLFPDNEAGVWATTLRKGMDSKRLLFASLMQIYAKKSEKDHLRYLETASKIIADNLGKASIQYALNLSEMAVLQSNWEEDADTLLSREDSLYRESDKYYEEKSKNNFEKSLFFLNESNTILSKGRFTTIWVFEKNIFKLYNNISGELVSEKKRCTLLDSITMRVQKTNQYNTICYAQLLTMNAGYCHGFVFGSDTASSFQTLREAENIIKTVAGDSSALLLSIYQEWKRISKIDSIDLVMSKKSDELALRIYDWNSDQRFNILERKESKLRENGFLAQSEQIITELQKIVFSRPEPNLNHLSTLIEYAIENNRYEKFDSLMLYFERGIRKNGKPNTRAVIEFYEKNQQAGNWDSYKRTLFEALSVKDGGNKEQQDGILVHVCDYYLSVGQCDSASFYLNIAENSYKQQFGPNYTNAPYNYADEDVISKRRKSVAYCKGIDRNFLIQSLDDILSNKAKISDIVFSNDFNSLLNMLKKEGLLDTESLEKKLLQLHLDEILRIRLLMGEQDDEIEEDDEIDSSEHPDSVLIEPLDDLGISEDSIDFIKYVNLLFHPNDSIDYNESIRALNDYAKSGNLRLEFLGIHYYGLGDLALRLKKWQDASIWFQKLVDLKCDLSIFPDKYDIQSVAYYKDNLLGLFQLYRNLGATYLHLNQLPNADTCFEYILTEIDKIPGFNIGKARLLGDCLPWFLQKKDFPRAITTLQKGVFLVNGSQQGTFNPQKVAGKETVLPVLYAQIANAYNNWYVTNKQAALLDSALLYSDYAMQAFGLACNFSDTYDPEQSLDFLNEDTRFYFEEAIRIRLTYARLSGNQAPLKESFQVCERCKAVQVRQMLWGLQAAQAGNIQPELLQQEKDLRRQMGIIERKIFSLLESGAPANTHTDLTNRLENLRVRRENVLLQIKKQAPDDYRRRFENYTVSIDTLQQKILTPHQTLLEYYLTDSLLITFVIRQDTFFMHTHAVQPDFKKTAKAFIDLLGNGKGYNKDEATTRAYSLYQDLIEPIAKSIPDSAELIIVPDGILSLLPFEALLTKESSKSVRPEWLIRKYPISYAISATVLADMKSRPSLQKQAIEFLGFAPVYQGLDTVAVAQKWDQSPGVNKRGGLIALTYNKPEVRDIGEMAQKEQNSNKNSRKGEIKYLMDSRATVRAFTQHVTQARVVHFSGHAKGYEDAGDYSFMLFSYPAAIDSIRLFAKDIYALPLQAELVTLSGCQTGLGRLNSGEGVIGLGRAFASAGAKSLVLSLWSVDDEATKDLMVSFYKHLMEGKPKNVALREAKLELIEDGKSPIYWAPFVQYGDTKAIFKQ